jgi:hypothetical protein
MKSHGTLVKYIYIYIPYEIVISLSRDLLEGRRWRKSSSRRRRKSSSSSSRRRKRHHMMHP